MVLQIMLQQVLVCSTDCSFIVVACISMATSVCSKFYSIYIVLKNAVAGEIFKSEKMGFCFK